MEVKLSKEFKIQTIKVIFAIILFGITYLTLLTGACFGVYYLGILGLLILDSLRNLIGLGITIGLISLSVFLFVFLVKFIFKSHKMDVSKLLEITPKSQPRLFAMINELVTVVGTNSPKKVYLSHEVNASVFYDSSFWSLIFPVKKNLHIGMGLINTITEEELKAILAHEFGHFSQKSMKVGSYVYRLNNIIFNILFDNGSFEMFMNKVASISGFIGIFLSIGMFVIQGIQLILGWVYQIVNKSYMALSREMEFHADGIAVNVTGHQPLQQSLLRMSLAEHSLLMVMDFFEKQIANNKKPKNVFESQTYAMNLIAKKNDFLYANGFPNVELEELNKFNKSKLVITDQWASHPSLEDRIANVMDSPKNIGNPSGTPANQLLDDARMLQETITQKLFSELPFKESSTEMSKEDFHLEFEKDYWANSFHKAYNGYYDLYTIPKFDLDNENLSYKSNKLAFLFSDAQIHQVYELVSMKNDLETLTQISKKEIDLNSFEYEGRKYKWNESMKVFQKIKKEIKPIQQKIVENDQRVYHYFFQLELATGKERRIKSLYKNLFHLEETLNAKYEHVNAFSISLEFTHANLGFDQIKARFIEIAPKETQFKEVIKSLIKDPLFEKEIIGEVKEVVEKYLSKDWKYFDNTAYHDDNLRLLSQAFEVTHFLLSRAYFLQKKKLLKYQMELYSISRESNSLFIYA